MAKCEFSVPSTIDSAARSGGQFLPTYDLASSRFHLLLAVGSGSTAALNYHTSRLETREAVDLTEYSGGASAEAEAEAEGGAEPEGSSSLPEVKTPKTTTHAEFLTITFSFKLHPVSLNCQRKSVDL